MAGPKDYDDEWGKEPDLDTDEGDEIESLDEVGSIPAQDRYPKRSRTARDEEDVVDFSDLDEYYEEDEGDDDRGLDYEAEELYELESDLDELEDDLTDDYWSYIDEEMGYAEIDRDTLPEAEVDLHDRIRTMEPSQLQDLPLEELSDYCLWSVARAYLAAGDEQAFFKVALPLVTSQKRSPALDYVDITLMLMCRCAARADFESAFQLLDRLDEVAPQNRDLKERFRGILKVKRGEVAEGLKVLMQLAEAHPDDACLLLTLGEDLCGLGQWEESLEYLEMARDIARSSNDQELLASIENAVQYAHRHVKYLETGEH